MTEVRQIFDRRLLTRRRARAAPRASEHDFLLRRVADDVVERLGAVNRRFKTVLDLGGHHGVLSRRLCELEGVERIMLADPAITSARPGDLDPRILPIEADEEALPVAEGSLDLVVSGLSLQLVNDLPGTLAQVRRALRPDGLFLAALLGGETLRELRQAFLVAEAELAGGASPRVAPFADVRDLGGLLQRAGFALPVVDAGTVTVTYADPLALVREIRAMGASNMLTERRRVPMTRGLLARALEIYRERFSGPDGRIRATFEIITLTAWVPHESQQKPLRPGSAKARLADALGVAEHTIGKGGKGG